MVIEINDWNDLDDVRNDLTADYILKSDLDSNTSGYSGLGDDWNQIGDSNNKFTGTFDGNEKTISDLIINSGGSNSGLFSFTGTGGVIKKLNVTNVDITGYVSVGSIVGNMNDGTVEQCFGSGDLTGNFRVGGIVGNCQDGATIKQCHFNNGSITVNDSDAGGIVGWINTTIKKCYSTVPVSGSGIGGLIGYFEGSAEDSYWDEENSGLTNAIGTDAGGTVSNLIGLTTSEMQGDSAETNMDLLDFTNVWATVSNDYPVLQFNETINSILLEFDTRFEYSENIQSGVFNNLKTILYNSLESGTYTGQGIQIGYILDNGTAVFNRDLSIEKTNNKIVGVFNIFDGDLNTGDEWNEIEIRDNNGTVIWSTSLTDPNTDISRNYVIKVEIIAE